MKHPLRRLDQIAFIRNDGGCTEVSCRYCHQHLQADWQKSTGSGHADDCDAILAGITVDQAKEDRKVFVATHTPTQVMRIDAMYENLIREMQEAFR